MLMNKILSKANRNYEKIQSRPETGISKIVTPRISQKMIKIILFTPD